ncbi:MAG: pirin-like C-terminal cupin domain-containing protein [Chryseolinea sp.]
MKLYSGAFAGLNSPIKNYTPVIIASITLAPGASLDEVLPTNFNTFLYVIKGDIKIGDEGDVLTDEVAWLDLHDEATASELKVSAGDQGAQFVLYGGLPQKHEIVSHGPFIADSADEIRQLYADFRHGKMEHIMEVADEQKFVY